MDDAKSDELKINPASHFTLSKCCAPKSDDFCMKLREYMLIQSGALPAIMAIAVLRIPAWLTVGISHEMI